MDEGSEEREEGEERGRSEEGSWNKEKPQAAWCQGVLQGKLFWGRKIEGRSRCVIHKPCTFPVIHLETVEGLKPCHLKIWFSEFCLSGLPFPSTFGLFSQKWISAMQAAIMSALKFPILSPAWFDLPLPDPSPCRLSWSSSIFFFFLPCHLIFRWPHPDIRRWHRCQSNHVKGTGSCQWWGSRGETVAPSGVVKKLKSPPAKRKPTDTGPLKIEEVEPSPALKKLLVKHMIGKVVFKKK